ncbi:hypothetical protein HanRHA438_Chr01g0036341 [Helianthus annuus]|nr:hypothetical protein HanRHA438_Chr01g0036341 [Helianthus annuus]
MVDCCLDIDVVIGSLFHFPDDIVVPRHHSTIVLQPIFQRILFHLGVVIGSLFHFPTWRRLLERERDIEFF